MVVWRCSAMMMIGAPEATAHTVKGVSYGVAETLKQHSRSISNDCTGARNAHNWPHPRQCTGPRNDYDGIRTA